MSDMVTYGLPSAFTLLRLSRGLLRCLHITIVLRRRPHGAGRAIAGDINLANSRDIVASIEADGAAGSIVVGHLQVPGKTTRRQSNCPSKLERGLAYPDRR